MALRKKRPSLFPEIGAPREAEAHFRALLDISFRVPSKGALPQGPLNGIPRREMPHHYSSPSFSYHSFGVAVASSSVSTTISF